LEACKPWDLRGKKGRIKRRMFEKLRLALYLKANGTQQQAMIGFVGGAARNAQTQSLALKTDHRRARQK